MSILLPMLIFLTVTFLIWGIYLVFSGEEGKVEKRLETYTQSAGDQRSGELKNQKGTKSQILIGVTSKLEKRSWIQKLELELQKADISLKGSEMVLIFGIMLIAGAGFGWMVLSWTGSLIGLLIGYLTPQLVIKRKQKRRLAKFNLQINDSLTLISNSLKAGFSFFQAIDLVSKEMSPPISREFGRVLKEINLGASTEEALKEMVERVGSADLDMVIQAVLIQRQVGGNLAEVLDKIGFTIRERIRIKAEIKTLTAQGRMSGFIIALLPVGLGLILSLLNPGYFNLLWTTSIGRGLIAFAVMLEVIGVMIIRKIVNIRI